MKDIILKAFLFGMVGFWALVPFVGCSHNQSSTSWKGKVTGKDYNYTFSTDQGVQVESIGILELLKEDK